MATINPGDKYFLVTPNGITVFGKTVWFRDIEHRNTESANLNIHLAWVEDATDDPTVNVGSALYKHNDDHSWTKLYETESMDMDITVASAIEWENILNKPDLALANHNHDLTYSKLNHKHDDDYAAKNHTHEEYSLTTHNHAQLYATVEHNHDSRYSLLDHNHEGVYSKFGHVHTQYAVLTVVNEQIATLNTNLNTAVSDINEDISDLTTRMDEVEAEIANTNTALDNLIEVL